MSGVQEPIGVSAIEDVIFPSHHWLGTEVGERDILPYFDNLAKLAKSTEAVFHIV